MELRYPSSKIGDVAHSIMMAVLTVFADLYDLGASYFGYFLGQWIPKRRGNQWKPGALEPLIER